MEWAALASAIIGFALWALKRYLTQRETTAPVRTQQEMDRDLVKADPTDLSLRLSRLVDKLRRKRGGGAAG